MINIGISDVRHSFSPVLDELDELTLIPLFHVAFEAFMNAACLPMDHAGVQTKRANIATLEGAVLARNYKVSLYGSLSDVLRKRFLAFLRRIPLDELREKVRQDLLGISPQLLLPESEWFYFGTGECPQEIFRLPLRAS